MMEYIEYIQAQKILKNWDRSNPGMVKGKFLFFYCLGGSDSRILSVYGSSSSSSRHANSIDFLDSLLPFISTDQ